MPLNFAYLTSILVNSIRADVAELVDAQVSEACSRKGVEVRFFSSAPKVLSVGRGGAAAESFLLFVYNL